MSLSTECAAALLTFRYASYKKNLFLKRKVGITERPRLLNPGKAKGSGHLPLHYRKNP